MAWPYLADIIKVTVNFNMFNKETKNILYVHKDAATGITIPDIQDVADDIHSAFFVQWPVFAANDAYFAGVETIGWEGPNQPVRSSGLGVLTPGVVVSNSMPANVALVTSHLTGLAGRSSRGRSYLAGIPETAVAANQVAAANIAQQHDLWDAVDTQLATTGFKMVVYSLYSGGAPRPTPLGTVITAREINSRVDTQRRRLP